MEEAKQLTKVEIINETVQYYSENTERRALAWKTQFCVYRTDDGKMCAVGRCFNESAVFSYESGVHAYSEVYDFEKHLKPQYRGHPIGFWIRLQRLHDAAINWDDEGLTHSGENEVAKLLEKYAD